MGDDLLSSVSSWLRKQGYPLELRVARTWQEAGADVIRSDYYPDPDTGHFREIDVVAYFGDVKVSPEPIRRVQFAVECKSSADKPWVVFTSDAISNQSVLYQVFIAGSPSARERIQRVPFSGDLQWLPLLQAARTGTGVVRAFGDQSDVPFAAVMSAAKAADFLSRRGLDIGQTTGVDVFDVAIPVVVIDCPLIECYLRPGEDEPTLEEVGRSIVQWAYPIAGKSRTIVHIVTATDLPSFVAGAQETAQAFLDLFQ